HDLRYLHFNVCYYAGIAHCIAQKLQRFEPGAGGEFKQLRGFDATETASMHWITDVRLRAAVADHLEGERAHVAAEVGWLGEHTALRGAGGAGWWAAPGGRCRGPSGRSRSRTGSPPRWPWGPPTRATCCSAHGGCWAARRSTGTSSSR